MNQVDTNTKSLHGFDITSSPQSRAVLADYSNRKCIQYRPNKRTVKQNDSHYGWKDKINTKDYIELRSTNYFQRPKCDSDKDSRPYQTTADDNSPGENKDFISPFSGDKATPKLDFDGFLCKEGSADETKLSLTKSLRSINTCSEEKENVGYSAINDTIRNKTIHHSFIKNKNQQQLGQKKFSQTSNYKPFLFGVVPGTEEVPLLRDSPDHTRRDLTKRSSIPKSTVSWKTSLQAPNNSTCSVKRDSKIPDNSINSAAGVLQQYPNHYSPKQTDTLSKRRSIHGYTIKGRPRNDEVKHAHTYAISQGQRYRLNLSSKLLEAKNTHQLIENTKNSLLLNPVHGNKNYDKVRVSCNGYKTKLITSESHGKIFTRGMRKMNDELVKPRTIEEISPKNFGTLTRTRGTVNGNSRKGSAVLNSNPTDHRVPLSKLQHNRPILRTGKGSRIDNQYKRSPELPTSPEKHLNDRDKTTSLSKEGQFTDGGTHRRTWHSGREDIVHYLTTHPRVINNETDHQGQNLRSSSEHRIGSFIYWESDTRVSPAGSTDYHYHNDSVLSGDVDRLINCVRHPLEIYEDSLSPDGGHKVKSTSETCSVNDIPKPQGHALDDLNANQHNDSDINNKKDQILLCQTDYEIKGAQHFKENTSLTGNEILCHGDLKRLPPGNYNIRQDQGLIIRVQDNAAGGLPLISDFSRGNDFKEERPYCGMNTQLEQTGNDSTEVGNREPSVNENAKKELLTDNTGRRCNTNIKTIIDLNKTPPRKPVILQEENIKDISSIKKENKSERKSVDKLVCSKAQNRNTNTNHVTSSISKESRVNQKQNREAIRIPPGAPKNRNAAGKTNRANVSSTCKRPGCKHLTLIGYKPEQKCSLAKHSQSYQKSLSSFTFPETANKDENLTCNSSSPAGSPSTICTKEKVSEELEKVSDNTCCEIITHALCISEDFSRQQESTADNINSDGCVRQSNVDGSKVSDKNVNKNNIKPIIVPVVDINGLASQSSPNEKIKQSGSTPTELTFDFEERENECNDKKHGNDNRNSIKDHQTNNEMEIGCDNISYDNNRGHKRGADQNGSVPDHSQLHGSKNEYKTRTKEFVSIQGSAQPRQGSLPTIDSMNQQLDAEQNQHSTVKDISPDNEHKRTKTKDERTINLKSGKANTASLIIKDTGIQLKDDKESLTNKRKSCRQTINKQSTKSKFVNRQSGIAVSGVPVPKTNKLTTTRKPTGHSINLIKGATKSNSGSMCISSPPESCGSSTKTFSETSNSPRSSIERSSESNPDEIDKLSDSQIPQSPKLRIHQTKTSRQRAQNASQCTKDSPTESKQLALSVSTGKDSNADRSSKISQKTPTMTRKNIPKDSKWTSSHIPSLAPKLNSAVVSPVLTKRTSSSPSVSRKSPLSPAMSKKKSTLSSAASRSDRRSSSASRSSKESTPDDTVKVYKKPTLHLRSQNAAEKASTKETKCKSQLTGPSLRTSKTKIPSTSTHLQANSGQNKPVISANVKTQRNAIPIRKVQLTSSIKTPDNSPNTTRKTVKTQEGLPHKSNEHNPTSYIVKARSTKENQPHPAKEMCEKDKPNHESMEPDTKLATTKLRKIQSTPNDGHCEQSCKTVTQTSQGKSPSPARKTKNIISPRVERKSTTKSPIANRKPANDCITGSPKLREKLQGKSMLPKTLKRPPKAVGNSSTLKIECSGNTEACTKDSILTRKTATGLVSQGTKNQKTIPKAKIANVQNVSAMSPTLTSKRVSSTSIPTTTQPKSESGQPMKKSNLTKSNIGAKTNIPAPRTSTPILHNSSILPRKKLSTTKTTSSKNNIKPASDIKIKTDRKETGGTISSKNDKIKRMRNEIANKEGTATSSYLSSKSRNINPQKLENIETSDENRCILSMAVDGYRETKISISSNDPTQRCTTDNSQISTDVIEGKKKCEGIVSINSSSTLETNSGQKINEANKTRNISTSSEEFWSASDDESLGNISSRDITYSNKTQCVGPSQTSYQVLDLGNISENTLEESSVAKFKENEENNFNKDHGEPSPVLVPHDYITETEAPTVQSNEEMAMRLPAIKQLRESQQCNYHVQVAGDRETNLKFNSKSDDSDHAIAKTIPLLGNDVHKDSTDLIPSNITHPLNRELDREVLTVNSVRLCKTDKNQYVSTDIETKLPELTNLRDYFDERNDNSKLQINEGSKGASQLVQLKKSFGNDHSKNTMDNLPNLSSENCVSAQQGTQDGLCSSNNETSDQKFSSDFLTLEKTLTSASEVKKTITLENVAPSCIESTSDFGPQVEDYDKKLNSYQNADNCTSGETLSASEPNPTNQNISNLSDETRTDLESESSDTSDQEGFESFDSDDGDSIMENGNCNIKFPTDDKTITAYTNNNMEIQRGPTRRITRQRRIITRSELSVRYETITTKILSPEERECSQETSETRASELSVKANEISQSSSCVVKPSCDGQVASHTVFSRENGDFINDEKPESDHRIINKASYFRDVQGTGLNTTLTEKEGGNLDQYAQNNKNLNRQEVITHCETTAESDTQNVFASFVLEDKIGQSVPKYSSNRLSDVNIVLKLQPEGDWPTTQGDSNQNTGNIEHEVNLTLNLNPEDQNNVSDSLTTYVTKSSSCESANSEDIKLCRISTGDNGSDYSKSESTTVEITGVNEFQNKQSGIKTQVHDFPTAHVSNRTNSDGLSDNKNHSESDVQNCNVTGDILLDNLENLQYKNETSIRGTSNHEQVNDDKIPTSFATCHIENKFETRTLPKCNDIDGEECNHVSDVADTQSPSVTDLGCSALPGGMSSTNQVKTTESVQTKPEHKDKFPAQSTDNVQDLITVSNSRETRMKNDMQTALKKERDRQGIRRFTATVCLQDVQESHAENRNKFRSRSKSPIGLKKEDGVESKQGVSCTEVNRVSEIRRTFLGKAAKINIPEPKIERNKPVSLSTQLNSRNSKWVNACGKWKRIPVDDAGNLLQGYFIPETVPVSSSTLSDIKEVTNEDKSKLESNQNEEQTVRFSDKRAMFEKPKSKQPPKVLPKPSEAKRRTVVSCLQQWKGRVADRRSKEFDDKFDPTKDRKESPISEQPKNQSENVSNTNIGTCELFCHLESKEVAKPVCVEKTNLQNSLGKSSEKMKRGNGYDNEKTCTNISAPIAISENVMKEEIAEKHWHIDQLHDQMNEYRSSENKEKSKVENNYSDIPLIDAETIDDLGTEQEENKEFHEKAKPDVDPCVLEETGETFLMRRDKVISRRKEMHSVRAAGVWDAVIDNERIQSSKDTACNDLEDSDDTTPTNTPKTRKTFVNQDNIDHDSGPSEPHVTPKLKAVKIKQEMFPLEGSQENVKSVTDSLKESLKTLNNRENKQGNVKFYMDDSDDDHLDEQPNVECQFEKKILYSPSLFGNYKNYQNQKHSNVGLHRNNGEYSEKCYISRQSDELLSEITEHEKGNGNDGESNLNKKGQSSDSCLNPVKDKKTTVSNPVSQRNVYNRSQSLPTTSLSNTAQHRIIYRNGHFVIETDYENRDGEAFEELEEDLSLESVEDAEQLKTQFNSGRSYSEANLTDSFHSHTSTLYDDDEDIDVFMRNENDVTVIENNNDGSSPNWHVLVKRRTKQEGHDSENRKSRPLSVDESQLQTSRMESDADEQSSTMKERKRPSENVKRRSASFRELGTAKLQRNSSFRKAQERGYPHSMTGAERNDSVGNLSLTPSEYSMCSDSGRSKGSGFFHKVFKKNKPSEKYTDPNKNKDSGSRKMSLKGLFTKKSKGEFVSQRSIDELISPPIAVFQGDMDIHVDSAPNSPYSSQFRRRHTSAEIYDGKAHSLPRKPADYQKSFKLTNENSSSSRLLAVQNLDNHPKRPISPKPNNVLIPRRNSNVSLPSSPVRDQYDGPFKTSMSKLDSDSASICSGGSSIVDASRYPPHIPESEMTPSNSNDSGIQRDVSFHSSSESVKRSRGQKQRYSCNCSSVDSNQFRTLKIHKSCECELAWMVKRSESLRENTFRYTENGCNTSKTNLYGSKSLPSTPLCRSSQRDSTLTKSAQRGTSESRFGGSPGSLGETICEERETGATSGPEWYGFTDGQEVDHFHFTGEDTSLFENNKEISLVKPQVSPESALQEELQDHVEEENQFNVSVNESEVFFTFTGSDTSLLEQTKPTASVSSSNNDFSESNNDIETESLGSQEAKQNLHTISKPDSCNETDSDNSTNEILENCVTKLGMEPRQASSVPVSLTTSFTGSMEESNMDQERPKSLYRELSRIGNMSLVQSKLMSWKAMEEQHTEPDGKQLLPFGCSGTSKRKNSKANKYEEDLGRNLEVTRKDSSLQSDELDVALFGGMESQNDHIGEGQDDEKKKGSESPIVPIESHNDDISERQDDKNKEGSESPLVPVESQNDHISEGQDDKNKEGSESPIVPMQSEIDHISEGQGDKNKEGSESPIVPLNNVHVESTHIESNKIVQSGDRINCETGQPSDRLETVQSNEDEALLLGDRNDQSDSLENYDLGDVEVEGVSSESPETAQDSTANVVRRRKSPSPRPERPKSEISVRWADLEESREITPVKRRESSRRSKQRPKSDLEDNIQLFDEMYEEVIDDYDFLTGGSSIGEDDMKPYGSHLCLLPYSSLQNLEKLGQIYSYDQKPSMRRMSTPHPIKTRLDRTPRKQRRKTPLVRSHSMPESLDKLGKRKKFLSTIASSNLHREDMLCHYDNDSSSDEGSEFSTDQISLHEKSLTSRLNANYLSTLRERPEPETLTYAEALWDHITMDPEELGFRAGDVIEVADMSDKDWWWGAIDDREGWFPATFVRLRVNQEHSDLGLHAEDILEHSSPVNRRISVINTDQARANVVNEIINAEREYVKHLKDVEEGYIRHARKREDMFSEDRISVIFGNMEDIYEFSQKFLESIENSFVIDNPHQSQLGHCFLECSMEFEIYSDYCNNHPSASGELKDLYRNKKYRHFFEACRLLQEMIEIPLEGFLLTPVQKICKYPLQLNELLKYTPVTHPDHEPIKGALDAMKKIATLINERKRKMESIEKLAYWQTTVEDWQGPDLLEDSSELIFAGEMNKVNSAGWSQERNFFLFDHQLVYCKKDLLKKNGYSYKGRIDLDDSEILDVEDGKDTQYNVTVKNAWKIHEVSREKWYLLVARSTSEKEKWMKAFANERKRVKEDQENNFVPLYWKRMVLNKIKTSQEKLRAGGQINYEKDFVRGMPSHATLPRSYGKKIQKKKGWFGFGNKKTK